ncbi:pyridoxal phosphate-dependent aminotransferase [Alphaproteobacteria bacterium LSUCC0684]
MEKTPKFRRASRIETVTVSDIVIMSEAARARRAEGHDVISLGIGEPDFTTPEHVNQAAIAAINAHDTKYPPIAGKPELREAVARLYSGRDAANVLISSGSKYSLLNAFLATINPGDEVILPAPFWTSYSDIVRLSGGVPVILETDAASGFKPAPDAIEKAITPRTRWLLLNSPGNPSGSVLTAAEFRAIGEVLEHHPQCWLMSDEIYEHLTYDMPFVSAHDALPKLQDRCLIINGVSKAYAMTGWRLGFAIGPEELIRAMTVVQSQGTSGTSTISQAAALAALTGPQELLSTRRDSFRKRRDLVLGYLRDMDGIETTTPDGAFYVFPSWQKLRGFRTAEGQPLENDQDFCRFILNAADTTIIPGSGFASPGHFRISYACSSEDLSTALGRMAAAISTLKAPR